MMNNIVHGFENDKFSNIISSTVAILGTVANYLWGGWNTAMSALVLFMVIDFITGILCGKQNKQLSSNTAHEGIFKKITILLLVAVAHKIDGILGHDGVVRNLVIFFYVGQEGISIVENSAVLGVPIPQQLKDSLIQLQDGNKKALNKEVNNDSEI